MSEASGVQINSNNLSPLLVPWLFEIDQIQSKMLSYWGKKKKVKFSKSKGILNILE